MSAALALAVLSSLCFGIALVTSRVGLRTLDPRSGAAISIPTATVLFALAAPFAFDAEGFSARAALLFALVGLFFPAIVTILTFRSNELLGLLRLPEAPQRQHANRELLLPFARPKDRPERPDVMRFLQPIGSDR